ncbi:TonB-dependent receptor P26 [Arenibacter antarcticus]|uniref:SusC/RagA family TonB-linked outer membrane protein n=1 Tax=Arenibacter antarcticus TaxID=2040469 RepID=A0ABW5VFU7_9FLAO|nr:SusC/RagA family TonB-linked outer membrane protein [Arenibacter sp. H213]MCM4168433.1 SusC/RagA family TonB-linked outer membrane protein [Arenibacter sp. H213]
MKTKLKIILTLILGLVVQITVAQESQIISGTVSDSDNLPLPGVNVLVKGTTRGVMTDFDGNYSIAVSKGEILAFTHIGMKAAEYPVQNATTINVVLQHDASQLEEVVVTALGITREKRSLGYATQEVGGDEVNTAKEGNFVNSLSGKVAGLSVTKSSTLGGSSNVIIRGYTSLTGNNQPLFVVDGVPISNENTNTSNQQTGRGGYDYGNAAMDVNPDDIASVNVLKGAAASALYGSRAANGVIIITTKKGRKNDNIGVTISSGVSFSTYDKDTFTKYQKEYGAGYGKIYGPNKNSYFNEWDVNGDGNADQVVPFTEDASYGGRFDPNLLVFQWDAFYPESSNYMKATPWVAPQRGPESIFKTGVSLNNSISIDGGTDISTYRLGYTLYDQEGILPNSKIRRNTVNFKGTHEFTEKLTSGVTVTYTNTDGKGRYGTGYSNTNIFQSMRQWNQNNVDFEAQKNAYFQTGRNITWNYANAEGGNFDAIYTDNPYWQLYENYQTDNRDRVYGDFNVNYKLTDWVNATGRVSMDNYTDLREERANVGSNGVSRYGRYDANYSELNYDLLLNFNYNITEDLNFSGLLGATARRQKFRQMRASTTGGLVIPDLFALANSKNLLVPPEEVYEELHTNGYFGSASFGYQNFLFLDVTGRIDESSSLPKSNNSYFYPSVSTSFVFSELWNTNWLTLGKFRANFAEVGNYAPPLSIHNVYSSPTNFRTPLYSVSSTANNPDLKNETTRSLEVGLEMEFFNRRLGFDVAAYKSNSIDQLMPVTVTGATGFTKRWVNAGEIENKGFETSIHFSPIRNEDFEWRINANWYKNESEVLSLFGDNKNLQLASLQGGVTINATVGQAYGTIWGTNFEYLNGERVIDPDNGKFVVDENPQTIGDINPDWKAGISNTLSYKNLSLSFLIDIQKGGDVFSLDTWYGYRTGVTANTAGLNEIGNPVRDPVSAGGGLLLNGVNPDGSPNDTRTHVQDQSTAIGSKAAPHAYHVYDASFVKLREATLSYSLPKSIAERISMSNITLSAIGRNLWIIDKNIPYSDPEAGLSSGNIQGYQSGAIPTAKEYGFNLKLQF